MKIENNVSMKGLVGLAFFALTLSICIACRNSYVNAGKELDYCSVQAEKTLGDIPGYNQIPRRIEKGSNKWEYVSINDWTSGFWPGILWYDFEYTHDEKVKAKADIFTMALLPVTEGNITTHDWGFMMFTSFGNGYRLTGNPFYKETILRVADSLATLFNPKVGTIMSWPDMVKKMNWPHNTIIDNMMNLEILFWAAKNGGGHKLYDIAVKHAETTMHNHFRPDYSSYHVVVYDTITGKKIKGVTHQGYGDETMWARGQAWAIYGFTMCYRETQKQEFLTFAQKVADVYLKYLPADFVPYWDFNAPGIPNEPKDASAAAVTASALLELSTFIKDKQIADKYRILAEKMVGSLSSGYYLSGKRNDAFLLHSTGHKPNNKEVDASIIYADYYYIEALIRLKKIQEGKNLYDSNIEKSWSASGPRL